MKKDLLKQLFISTFYLSAFTFGGGYVIISLMKEKFVNELNWIDKKEMLDLVAIAQSAPGAVAINGAIVIGYKLAGWKGILTATLATVLPPFMIISIISIFYHAFRTNILLAALLNGMQAGVAAIICSAVYDMAKGVVKENYTSVIIMILAFIAAFFLNIDVTYIILFCIALALLKIIYTSRKGKR